MPLHCKVTFCCSRAVPLTLLRVACRAPGRIRLGLGGMRRKGAAYQCWSSAPARTARSVPRLCTHPPAPAGTALAYTPGDRTSSAPQANNRIAVGVSRVGAMHLVRVNCHVSGAKSACGRWPLSVRASSSMLAVSQSTGSHTKLPVIPVPRGNRL